jgi:hypothetical protein
MNNKLKHKSIRLVVMKFHETTKSHSRAGLYRQEILNTKYPNWIVCLAYTVIQRMWTLHKYFPEKNIKTVFWWQREGFSKKKPRKWEILIYLCSRFFRPLWFPFIESICNIHGTLSEFPDSLSEICICIIT